MGDLNNLVSGATFGLTERAIIKVIEGKTPNSVLGGEKSETAGVKLAGPNLTSVKIAKGAGAVSIGSVAEGAVYGSSPEIMAKCAQALGGMEASVTDAFKNFGKSFTVPFNPASFSLSGNAGGRVENTDFSNTKKDSDGSMVSFEPAPLTIRLDVDLVLNDVDPSDAFIETNATNVKGITKSIGKVTGETAEHSIRKEVEG